MILQRTARKFKEQDWGAVLVEILVVVVGILIGLQANAWNDMRKDRILEREYLERIKEELSQDVAEINEAISIAEERRDMGKRLLAAIDDPDLVHSDPTLFIRAIEQAGYTYTPAISDFSYSELKFDGNLGIIRDTELRRALTLYYKQIENYGQWAYVRGHAQNAYDDAKLGILTPQQSAGVMSLDAKTAFTEAEALAAFERMVSKPYFAEQLHRASNNFYVIRNLVQWRDAAEQLRDRVDRGLH